MRIGTLEVNINPTFPVNRMLSEEKHLAVADDLNCRLVVFDKGEGRPFLHLSVDTVELYRAYRDRLKAGVEAWWGGPVDFVTSATHSHFCPCLTTDTAYQDFVYERLMGALDQISYTEVGELTYSYRYRHFDQVGTSRVSGHGAANIYAETLSFYGDGRRLVTFLMYNSHATTMKLGTGDFTSEYIGRSIAGLTAAHPGEFFTFMLGPAGEVSPRNTRKSQEYEEMVRLAGLVQQEFEEQLSLPAEQHPASTMAYREEVFPVGRATPDFSGIPMPEGASERELMGIKLMMEGKISMGTDFAERPLEQLFAHWAISPEYSVIFEPFETYSTYYSAVDKDRCSLATISNGFDHYVCEIDPQELSMEVLSDNTTRETKVRMYELFERWSAQEDF